MPQLLFAMTSEPELKSGLAQCRCWMPPNRMAVFLKQEFPMPDCRVWMIPVPEVWMLEMQNPMLLSPEWLGW